MIHMVLPTIPFFLLISPVFPSWSVAFFLSPFRTSEGNVFQPKRRDRLHESPPSVRTSNSVHPHFGHEGQLSIPLLRSWYPSFFLFFLLQSSSIHLHSSFFLFFPPSSFYFSFTFLPSSFSFILLPRRPNASLPFFS